MERGLQETERVDEAASEAQLLPDGSSQPRSLHAVLVQVKLLLGLFADQLGLQRHTHTHTHTYSQEEIVKTFYWHLLL